MTRQRDHRGGILIMFVLMMPFLLCCFLAIAHVSILMLEKERLQIAADAAALAAANELSRIVVEDPHFGPVALSDYPAIGEATLAADGQPLPVLGINTMVATARLDLLIARDCETPALIDEAVKESMYTKEAAARLTAVLKNSVQTNNPNVRDLDGQRVAPRLKAAAIVDKSLGDSNKAKLQLMLGTAEATTATPLPNPASLALVPPKDVVAGNYRAFVNMPVDNQDFYFVGEGKQSRLVNVATFAPAEKDRPASIVLVSLQTPEPVGVFPGLKQNLSASAAAAPWTNADVTPPGILVFSTMVDQPLLDMTLKHLIDRSSGQGAVMQSQGGDYRRDPRATLVQCRHATANQYLSQALIDWLRSAHLRPRIDSTIALLNAAIDPKSQFTIYSFPPKGQPISFSPLHDPFSCQTLSENQTEFTSDDLFGGPSKYRLTCQNQIANLGNLNGGLHAGQLLPGDPVNWMDLNLFTGGVDFADVLGVGQHAMNCSVIGSSDNCTTPGVQREPLAVSDTTAQFATKDGSSALNRQPRQTYYAGGEAIYITIQNTDSDV